MFYSTLKAYWSFQSRLFVSLIAPGVAFIMHTSNYDTYLLKNVMAAFLLSLIPNSLIGHVNLLSCRISSFSLLTFTTSPLTSLYGSFSTLVAVYSNTSFCLLPLSSLLGRCSHSCLLFVFGPVPYCQVEGTFSDLPKLT